jgi:ABC-2 type transport system ATP-binding protein
MIKVDNLVKKFGQKTAVDGVTFSVERGEVLGFLGPNGAGKSTTMRMVTGFIPPTSGTIRIGNANMLEQPIQAKRLLGYLPENAPLYLDMDVYSFLGFAAELRGFSGEAKKKAIHRAVEMCFLDSVLYQSIDTLSKGYRHRTCFAQSIIHDPEVLVMDEPTDGLDPNQKHEMRSLIRRMGAKKAIVFSTHILEEVEAACTRAIIIDRGQIVANGTPSELKKRSDLAGTVSLKVIGLPGAGLLQKLDSLPTVRKSALVSETDGVVSVRVFPQPKNSDGELARSLFELLAKENCKVEQLNTEEGRLDEVFRGITKPDTAREGRS